MVMLYKEVSCENLEAMERSGRYVSQQKVDGDNFKVSFRKFSSKNTIKKSVRLINRHGNEYTDQFPEITAGFKIKNDVEAVLNGEIAYWNEEKQIYDFNIFRGRQGLQRKREIMRRRLLFPCKFYVFDLIEYDGISMVRFDGTFQGRS